MSTKSRLIVAIIIVIIIGIAWFFLDHRYTQPPLASELASQAATSTAPTASTHAVSATTNNNQSSVKNFMHTVTIRTSKGAIVFETYDADAPNTVKNFITLANKGFYNGLTFHRIISGFMIQGGDPMGTGTGGPGYEFADELDPNTPSYRAGYVRGTVAMANAGPDTNGSQFFIMQKDTALLHNYTIFGKVISGMDVVDAVAGVAVDANNKPLTPVTMGSVTAISTN